MASPHPIWRGHLRLALVTCPVALYSAHHDRGSLHFNYINPDTGNRIRMITQDAETGEELQRRDLAKGYEFKKDTYLILTDEDFDSARIESSSTMKIEKFVESGAIDPIYYDSTYYLAPDGEAGADVFVVLRDAIAATGQVALTRVVIARRERAVAIMPLDRGLVAHTLHEERDLNAYKPLFENLPTAKPDPEMVTLAKQLISRQVAAYDPSDAEDRYESRLREVIEAKLKGEGIEPEVEETPDRGNVVDLMAALRSSLAGKEPAGPAKGKPQKPDAKAEGKAEGKADGKAGAKPTAKAKGKPPAAAAAAAKPATRSAPARKRRA